MAANPSTSRLVALICNAAVRSQAIHGVEAIISLSAASSLAVSYRLFADINRLRMPLAAVPRRVEGLWQHTCFEAFIRTNASPDYYEFNFSPSGEWAAYSFRGYRDGRPIEDVGLSPEIVVRREADKIELDAVVRLDRLSAIPPGATLQIGLSAVIEDSDGKLSYWALNHPTDKPDFHHPDSFVLEFALPDGSA
jgi:hypothetical protein